MTKHETSEPIFVNTAEEELRFVDPDIAEACRKMTYQVGLPTQMQICKNLRELLEFLKEEVKDNP